MSRVAKLLGSRTAPPPPVIQARAPAPPAVQPPAEPALVAPRSISSFFPPRIQRRVKQVLGERP